MAALAIMAVCALWLSGCKVNYGFNGSSIDYNKTKTITIADFPIRSSYVWGPMGPMFNTALKDQFAHHTRLQRVTRYAAQTELSITVNVRFTNRVNHAEDFERTFTSTASYETTRSLVSVQQELVQQMVNDLAEQIFNATVANW